MNPIVLGSLRNLVSRRLGLHIREIDLPEFQKKLQQRLTANAMGDFGDYYRLLDSSTGESEWNSLIPLLTTGETYFFRDKGQIQLLQNQLLPDLIERRRLAHQAKGIGRPSLRIWSAGCSYGEEPYTVAMLLTQLIPDIHQWDILVLGTDLNPESIQKAKRGVYGQWSFRQVDRAIVTRYFTEHGSRWKVKPEICNLVRLRTGNLVTDDFSAMSCDSRDMDLIICRNVFIYFQPSTIATIVGKFHTALRSDGYFVTGHTELQGQDLSAFHTLNFNQSVAYQKSSSATSRPSNYLDVAPGSGSATQLKPPLQPSQTTVNTSLNAALNALSSITASPQTSQVPSTHTVPQRGKGSISKRGSISKQAPAKQTPLSRSRLGNLHTPQQSIGQPLKASGSTASSQDSVDRARQKYDAKQYDLAIQLATEIVQSNPNDFEALHLLAQIHSDRADFVLALQYAQSALDIDPTSVETLYLMACMAEAQGDLRKTKQLLKQVIYLAPDSVSAYLILGDLYQQEGDRPRATKMRQSAVTVLQKLSPDTPVSHQGETAAAASLLSQLQAA